MENWFNCDAIDDAPYNNKKLRELDAPSSRSTSSSYLSYADDDSNECRNNGLQGPINMVPRK